MPLTRIAADYLHAVKALQIATGNLIEAPTAREALADAVEKLALRGFPEAGDENLLERDGILANLYFLDFMGRTGKTASQLAEEATRHRLAVEKIEAASCGERLTGSLDDGHAGGRITVDREPYVGEFPVSVAAHTDVVVDISVQVVAEAE